MTIPLALSCVSCFFRSTDDPVIGAELRKYISQPYFLPGSSVDENVAWIFMGSPGPGASLHVSQCDTI